MRWRRFGLLLLCLVVGACSTPTSPTTTTRPGVPGNSATWEGTLTRAGASTTVTMTVAQDVSPTSTVLLSGSFVAVYPAATYSGFIVGAIEQNVWNSGLIPFAGRQCAVPLTTTSGTTVLLLTAVDEDRMTGEAILVECEGRTTWTAEFVRR
jgi:hypothetical protein